jgi:hypothetical protein
MGFGALPQSSVWLGRANGLRGRSPLPAAPTSHGSYTRRANIAHDVSCASKRLVGVCRAIAELDAPPAQTGLQLEVSFEEPLSKIPATFITTTARVVASAFLVHLSESSKRVYCSRWRTLLVACVAAALHRSFLHVGASFQYQSLRISL